MKQEIKVINKQLYIDNKNIGVVDYYNKKLIQFKDEEKHKFRKYDGWGWNKKVLQILLENNIENIEIQTKDKTLLTSIYKIIKSGIIYNNKGEEQVILPEKFFVRVEKEDKNE